MSETIVVLKEAASPGLVTRHGAVSHNSLHHLRHVIEHSSHLLPAQGPITVFIHHNTLHAFEDFPFERAVEHAGKIFDCQPYLSESRYRQELGHGRIRFADLREVLVDDLGASAVDLVPPHGSRLDLRLAMLQYPLASGTADELRWFMAETAALRRLRPEASAASRVKLISETRHWVMRDLRGRNGNNPEWLQALFDRFGVTEIENWDEATWEAFTLEMLWQVCQNGASQVKQSPPEPEPGIRHRDLLLEVSRVDTDQWVNDLLIRFTAAFLDQGVSHWHLPGRDKGFFQCFCSLYRRPNGPPDAWMRDLAREAARLQDSGIGPLESAADSLVKLGIPEEEWDEFLSATLLALRGWGGMVREVEIRGDRVPHPIPAESVVGFVAVRLLLDRLAYAHAARESLDYAGSLSQLRDELRRRISPPALAGPEERAFPVFQLAQVMGWTPDELHRLDAGQWEVLIREINNFGEIDRRRVLHLAYEIKFRNRTLDALALHERRKPVNPRFQVVTCIDDREESFRRHLEEIAPDCETFGAAGFFAVPMYYRGITDAHFVPLCPIVITPRHWVEEQADESSQQRLRRTHRMLGTAAHGAHVGSRSAAMGALLTGTLGVLASVPLVARIIFPRLTAQLRRLFGRVFSPPASTRLKLERSPECEPGDGNGHLGFTLDEMVNMAERLLRDIGLIDGFSRLVLTLGHGSSSLNNPHKSAYDCGACGGTPGAPNGRAIAFLLNDERVRRGLAERGIRIPDTTWFVGGYHNTCDDSVSLFELDRVPATHAGELERIKGELEQTCSRNAHERCRRFMSAPLTMSFEEAKQHVEGRSEDLAQTRPELGHATNAICHVGRRERTRGLFFDRRNFLTSYDPTQDDENGTVLARTMAAVFPVCGGINLEYFFSHVDSPGYGCSTKLPHNVTSLLGVMDGPLSDLRTGLPWQMTEIHEPVRLVIICETTKEIMQRVLDGNPPGKRMVEKGWVILAIQSPETNDLLLFHKGEFRAYKPQAQQLPTAASSVDWYRGWRDHLEFAEILETRTGQGPGVALAR